MSTDEDRRTINSPVWRESIGVPGPNGESRDDQGEKDVHDSSQFEHCRSQSRELTRETDNRIHSLARVFSGISRVPSSNVVNPFDDHKIPALDPFSSAFDAEQWAKNYFRIVGGDPDRYLQRTAGVSYTDLTVFGYGSDTDYQKDVVNVIFYYMNIVKKFFRSQRKVPILTGFEGLIRSGEMCVVLGRPGR